MPEITRKYFIRIGEARKLEQKGYALALTDYGLRNLSPVELENMANQVVISYKNQNSAYLPFGNGFARYCRELAARKTSELIITTNEVVA